MSTPNAGRALALLLLGGVPPNARAATPSCGAYPWVIADVFDTTGKLQGDDAWRLAQITHPGGGAEPANPRSPLCPGDRVEVWHGARVELHLSSRGWGAPVGSIQANGGSVLTFGEAVVQRRGTATYLFPEGKEAPEILARLDDSRSVRVDMTKSTFQMSMSDGCEPEVEVLFDDLSDPWEPVQTRDPGRHGGRLQIVDEAGQPLGPPLTVQAGELARVSAGDRRPTKVTEDPERVRQAKEHLQEQESAIRKGMAERTAAPRPDEWPTLRRAHRLQVVSDTKPTSVLLDGQPWAPLGWWRSRDEAGVRVWEAARPLQLADGPHLVEVGRGKVDELHKSFQSAPPAAGVEGVPVVVVKAERGVAGVTDSVLPADEAVTTPVQEHSGPLGVTIMTTSIPDAPITFIALPGGSFLMGSPDSDEMAIDNEKPQHKVTVSGFQIARTELTQAQWKSVVLAAQAAGDPDAAKLNPDPSGFKGDTLPVESVSWCETARFSNALSRLEGLTPAYTVSADCDSGGAASWDKAATSYRLPTEAEWEYAARAHTQTRWSFGDDVGQLCTYANVSDQTAKKKYPHWAVANCDDGYAETAPVCSFKPNPWDLCDMHGNVKEWTWDWYSSKTTNNEQANPDGAPSGDYRVLRGGSWFNLSLRPRSAFRGWDDPWTQYPDRGLRLVRTLPVPVPPADP